MVDQLGLVQKVSKDVDYILRRGTNLTSFEIVPVDSNERNKSPVLTHGTSLGLESWCIKHVYTTCYSQIMETLSKSKKKNTLVDTETLAPLLNIVLLINPDLSTLWNKRREFILKEGLKDLKELHFTQLVLSRKPKCNEALAYRKWILENFVFDESVAHDIDLAELVSEELSVCTAAAEQNANNYHAWSHRIWLLQKLSASQYTDLDVERLFCSEYAFSEQWSVTNISDHSGFNYRQFCIRNVLKLSDNRWREFEKYTSSNLRRNFLKMIENNLSNDVTETEVDLVDEESLIKMLLGKSFINCSCKPNYNSICRQLEILFYELNLNDELIRFYKNHETLWYHRRFIIHHILSALCEYYGVSRKNVKAVKNSCGSCQINFTENKAKMVRYDADSIYSSRLFLVLISCDKKLTSDQRSAGDNYADRHEKYLKFIEGVNA